MLRPLVLALMVLLAGCMSDQEPPTRPLDTDNPAATSTSAPQPEPNNVPVPSGNLSAPLGMSMNGCYGMETAFEYANLLGPMPTPEGWEANPTTNGVYFVEANICERISVGAFERGPVGMVFEGHRFHAAPDGCQDFEPEFDAITILMSVWIDDADLVAYLRESLGLPVEHAIVGMTTQAQGDNELQTWAWTPAGAATSSLIAGLPDYDTGVAPMIERLAWVNEEGGISFFDMDEDVKLPQISPFVTTVGTLEAPTWYGEQVGNAYGGLLSVWTSGDLTGPIYRFGDLACAQRIS